jgi:hypothetical protein
LQVQQIIKQSNKKRIYNLSNLFTLIESRIDSSFATARQSRERASAQRESTEVDRVEVEIEKLREQLGQYEELRSMRESAYREREGSPAVRYKEPLYDNYVPPGVTGAKRSSSAFTRDL